MNDIEEIEYQLQKCPMEIWEKLPSGKETLPYDVSQRLRINTQLKIEQSDINGNLLIDENGNIIVKKIDFMFVSQLKNCPGYAFGHDISLKEDRDNYENYYLNQDMVLEKISRKLY